MDKERIITKIVEGGLVAVVRAESSEEAFRIAEACIKGGVVGIEITFTVPGADRLIWDLSHVYGNGEILIGAGTVMDPETARIAILSGAQYIVSPYLNLETVKLCNRYRVPCMPGATSIREVVEAMEAGADIIKIFPGELLGPNIIKSILGPIPYAKLMPTGGVTVDNVEEWIKAGAVAVGVGSALTKGAKTGDFDSITKTAEEFILKIKKARNEI
ncbi:MAG: bifunctional 2-keto-4-hydroxyglutarate aldolase/2-keto-3-deoxy-6-phosphogluconate aldolase [Caldicoprobacterales bacterium]|jgi:2-dehydro-3-deoxyphosphogluconate aldolase/(4S)-4-hydroxy-2-oxoglutarate aldolase|nr:bifunctional 2-keto-4-hydroxyglutarate aldolase/2-keto-3-deoxy-6-phosphogluconate aldolase [Clostridiales bacterium]